MLDPFLDRPHLFMNDNVFQSAPYRSYGYSVGGLSASYHYADSAFSDHMSSPYMPTAFVSTPLPVPAVSAPTAMAPTGMAPTGMFQYSVEDYVQRTNLEILSTNAQLLQPFSNIQIHPMMLTGGFFPAGFATPRRIYDFLEMEDHRLEHIMLAYQLSRGTARYQRALRHDFLADRYGLAHPRPRRLANLIALFEHLGAHSLAEYMRRRGCDRSLDLRRPGARILDCY